MSEMRCAPQSLFYCYAQAVAVQTLQAYFSVTSGTIFANRKKSLQTYLYIIAKFVNAAKGISSLQLSRDADVNYRTAFVLSHKIRQSLLEKRDTHELSGLVEMDGTYVHPAPRKANKKTDRIDYRLKENQSPDKRCVMVAREHYTEAEKQADRHARGAKSTHVFVTYSETQSVVQQFADKFIQRGTRIHTDESNAYSALMPHYDLHTVNHQHEYRSDAGITNNQAESYFSRFKRMYYGQVHKMSNVYLLGYANEIAYRKDNRRKSNGWQFRDVLEKCLTTDNNTEWCGYWQRKHIAVERILQMNTLICQLRKELKALAFEKKQILEHLNIVNTKIDSLNKSLNLMLEQKAIEEYNTPNYTYRKGARLFSIKITHNLMKIMKSEARSFTIAELTLRLFEIEDNLSTPAEKHYDAVRKRMNKLYAQGFITRTEISRRIVKWQWKG